MATRIYTDINDIVNDYMLNLDDDDYGKNVSRGRVRNLAYAAIRDLQFDTLKNITSVVLPINENTQKVTLPEDFVDYIRVGVLNNNNEFMPLGINNSMSNVNQVILLDNLSERLLDSDGAPLTSYHTPTENTHTLSADRYILSLFNTSQYSKGGFFGLGGGYSGNGSYRFDKENNALFVNTSVASGEVVLEYIADESMKKNPRILTYAVEAVHAFIYKSIIKKKVGVNATEKRDANRAYTLEKRKVRARVNKLNKAEIMMQISKRTQSAPRDAGRIYN